MTEPTIRIPIDDSKPHFVWIYWNGGAQGDELRWSLRSVCRHFDNPNCWVIGNAPSWYCGNTIHRNRIPAGPTFRPYADQWQKVNEAIQCALIPDKFCWIMDDVYFLKPLPFDSLEVPRRVRKMSVQGVNSMRSRNLWRRYKRLTCDVLISRGMPLGDFVTHGPAVMDKDKMRHVMAEFNVLQSPLSWELIYYNSFDWPRIESWNGWMKRITHSRVNYDGIRAPICNNSVNGWTRELRQWLRLRFPDQSILESTDAPAQLDFRNMNPRRTMRRRPATLTAEQQKNRLNRILLAHVQGKR